MATLRKTLLSGVYPVIIIILCFPALASSLERPLHPVVYAAPSGGIELYWFYPTLHLDSVGCIRETDSGLYVDDTDEQNAFLTRFSVNPPILITQVSTYLVNQDLFPSVLGDQFSPIGLSLKRRDGDGRYYDYWNQLIHLDSSTTGNGARIDCTADLMLYSAFEIWTGLEWQPGFPTAPLVGFYDYPPLLEQYICAMDDSLFQLEECNYNSMVEINRLGWTDTSNLDSDTGDDSLSFMVYFTEDTADFFSPDIPLEYVNHDSLYARLDILSDGYLYIAASDGVESILSDFVRVETAKLPSLIIQPEKVDRTDETGLTNSFIIILQNNSESPVPVSINYDHHLLAIVPDSFVIGGDNNFSVRITPELVASDDSPVNATIFFNSGEAKYPIIYHVRFAKMDLTEIKEENNTVLFPSGFKVGYPQPNPFNGRVSFNLENARSKELFFDVYNLLGQNIFSEKIDMRRAGRIFWDGTDNRGESLPSGIYFFRFYSGEYQVYRKALLLK